ncbi:Diaminopimelate epimerase [Buchnera aphidicola (Drepanosiphum platanoidis)]
MFFSKMQSLGNDFVILENLTQNFCYSSSLIKSLSNRKLGIGFDQLLIVESSKNKNADFFYRIFNADGTEVSQCGNGARCFAKFLFIKGFSKNKKISIQTKNRIMSVLIQSNKLVTLNIGKPIFNLNKIPFIGKKNKKYKKYFIKLENKKYFFDVLSVGNPHCVLQVKNFKKLNIQKIGSFIESHKFFPNKTNVNFMKILNNKKIFLRIYERGVGETQSCGSGACASVVSGILNKILKRKKICVNLLGGNLEVEWKKKNDCIYVTGPVFHVYDGFFYI